MKAIGEPIEESKEKFHYCVKHPQKKSKYFCETC